MFIECPACKTRAQLPDSKEGAKVRCPECDRVYVARPAGTRTGGARAKKQDPTMYLIVGGAVVVIAVLFLVFSGADDDDKPVAAGGPPVAEEPAAPAVVETGWNAPLVQQAVAIHDQVYTSNTIKLFTRVDFERAYAWRDAARVAAETAAAEAAAAEVTEGEEPPAAPEIAPLPEWSTLSKEDQKAFQNELVDEMTQGSYRELLADWKPYDGVVVSEDDDGAVVHLTVHHRESKDIPDRTIEWRFTKEGDKAIAWAWERWISPEEQKAARRTKKTVKKTLSDGSQVIEGVVDSTRLEYHAETPEELRTEIEATIDQLIDPTARPKELTAARNRLTEIGKHAVPGLIMRMGEIPPDSDANLIQLNQIHLILQDVTGYLTTFDVHVAMGTTEERQQSGIAQWFGWYDRKFKRYWNEAGGAAEAALEEDPFWNDPDFQPRNEKERREFEKLRKEYEAQQKKDG